MPKADRTPEEDERIRKLFAERYDHLAEADFAVELNKRIRGRSDLEVAQICHVSRPSVDRWKRGLTAPHRLGRPSVFYALDKDVVRIWLKAA
jgi:hypothetical protein